MNDVHCGRARRNAQAAGNGFILKTHSSEEGGHGTRSIAEWLVAEAKALGISGATMSTAQGGYGRDGRLHWANFFELSEQPLEVTMALSDEAAERLLARIAAEGLRIFYTKVPVEFGITGEK